MVLAPSSLTGPNDKISLRKWAFLDNVNFKDVLGELLAIVFVIVISAFVSYSTPFIFRLTYYIMLVGIALISKRDYFWIGFFYFLSNEPAYLFWSSKEQSFIPDLRILSGITITIFDLYLVGLLVKAIGWPRVQTKAHFSSLLKYMLFYILFVTLPVSFIEFNSNVFLREIRFLFYYSLIFSMSRLIVSPDQLFRMLLICIPALFIIAFDQFYTYINGQVWIAQLNPWFRDFRALNIFSGTTRAVAGGLQVGYAGLLLAGLFQVQKAKLNWRLSSNWILGLVALVFFLSITRNLIVFLGLFLGVMSVFYRQGIMRYILAGALFLVLLFGAISIGFLQSDFIETTMARLGVLGGLASGNIEQSDTFQSRLDNEFVDVQNAWLTSPLLGTGLTAAFQNGYSTDVGFLNTLMLFGVFGSLIFLIFLFRFVLELWNQYRKSTRMTKDLYIPLIASVLAFLPLYLTIIDLFLVHPYKVFYFSILLIFADKLYDRDYAIRQQIQRLKANKE